MQSVQTRYLEDETIYILEHMVIVRSPDTCGAPWGLWGIGGGSAGAIVRVWNLGR